MKAAKNGAGSLIMNNSQLNDPRLKGTNIDKWSYSSISNNGVKAEVHYLKDSQTGKTYDFKFK